MTFEEMALNRQSCREFENKIVEDEKLIRICEISSLAPSSCNSQPWKFHIIKHDSKELNAVRKSCQDFIPNKFLDNVTSFIIVEQVEGNMSSKIGERFTKNDMNSLDLGIAISHITFEALELGIQSCIIGAFKNKTITQAMGLSESSKIRIAVAIGYAASDYPIRNKKRKDKEKYLQIH